MAAYVIIYFLNLILSFLEIFTKINKKILYFISFVIIVFFIAFSYFIGADWDNYYINYYHLPTLFKPGLQMPKFIDFEKGFQCYTIFLKTFFSYDNYRIISNFIDIFIIYIITKNYTKYPVTLIFIYFGINFYSIEVEALRQAKAIIFFLLSLKYLEEERIIKYIILNIIGFTFHKSAIIFIPVFIFHKFILKEKKLQIKKILFLFLLLFLFRDIVIFLISEIILRNIILHKYIIYLKDVGRNYSFINIVRNIVFFIPLAFLLVFKEKTFLTKKYFLVRNMYIFFLITFILGNKIEFIERFNLYTSYFYCVTLLYLLEKKLWKKIIFIFFVLISLKQYTSFIESPFTRNYRNIVIDNIVGNYYTLDYRIKNNSKGERGKELFRNKNKKMKLIKY